MKSTNPPPSPGATKRWRARYSTATTPCSPSSTTKRNLWWFDVPVALLRKGQPDWVNLLLHTPETDELQHLKVPVNFLQAHQEQMEVTPGSAAPSAWR
jgi:hypothetical protein